MNGLYAVDGVNLTPGEDQRHRGALNAALNAMIARNEPNGSENASGGVDMSNEEWRVGSSFDYADEVVREYRKRCGGKAQTPPPPPERYRLASDAAIIEAWVSSSKWVAGYNSMIEKVRESGRPLYAHEIIDLAPYATFTLIAELVREGVLIPEEVSHEAP